MVGHISVLNSRELLATVFAVRAAPAEIRKNIRQYSRQAIQPQWSAEIKREAASGPRVQQALKVIANTSKVSVSDRGVRVRAAGSRKRALSGGLIPVEHGLAIEFGSNRYRQLRPRTPRGTAFFPAATEMQPRVLALWVQTTVKTIGDALDGKS